VIAMVSHPQAAFDQLGNPLRGPQLRPVAVGHGPVGQQTNEPSFLLRCQPRGPTARGLGLQRRLPASSERIEPTQHTAGVAADSPSDLMQRQLLLEERDHTAPTLL